MRAHRLAAHPSLQLLHPLSIGRSKGPKGSVFHLEQFKQSLRDRNALSAAKTPAVNIAEEPRRGQLRASRAAGGARRETGQRRLERESPRAGEEASRSARCADRGRPPAAAEEAPGTAMVALPRLLKKVHAVSTQVNITLEYQDDLAFVKHIHKPRHLHLAFQSDHRTGSNRQEHR